MVSASPPPAAYRDPSDAEVLSAAAAVVRGETSPALAPYVEQLCFLEAGELPPDHPLQDRKLRFLFGYWARIAARKPDGTVAKADIDIVELKSALGNLLLLDVERDGLDAVYRVYGTGVADQAGRDWTGYRVSQMNRESQTPLALVYRACYRAVWERRQPLYNRCKSPPWLPAKAWQRLILPLTDGTGRCSQFLVGSVPVDPKPLSYEDRKRIRERR